MIFVKNYNRLRKVLFFLVFFLLISIACMSRLPARAASTKTGFQKIQGKTYFIKPDGTKYKGWLVSGGYRYYFSKSTGQMKTGWVTLNSKKYYFGIDSGKMKTGKVSLSGKYYYFGTTSGAMQTGWIKDNGKIYYASSGGSLVTGLCKISGKYYYFSKKGVRKTGWITYTNGKKRYFLPSTGVMATGTVTISGKNYKFSSKGYLQGSDNTNTGISVKTATSAKTIRNYLLQAMQPVGRALYVYGGGWLDSTRKGISQTWQNWYNSQSSSYNYSSYSDLSAKNRVRGLDCSGFVGWAAYQVMHTTSGVGNGYTVVAKEVGSYYSSLGWGSIITPEKLKKNGYKLYAGDVGYNSGHTWIVIGQCSDLSVVIVHSTSHAGCQISGTPTPSGNYNSKAIALAKKYMAKYPGYKKYSYHINADNYLTKGYYLRWNSKTLSDPDGYKSKTADQILKDMYGY